MSEVFLQGLPPVSSFKGEEDMTETFSSFRTWLKRVSAQGSVAASGQALELDHRRSIVKFLRQVSQNKLRGKLAREMLAMLEAHDDWCCGDEGDDATPNLAGEGPEACQSGEAVDWQAVTAARIHKSNQEFLEVRLPPFAALDGSDPKADAGETFNALRKWVKAQHQANRLAAVGGMLNVGHRRSIFAFLGAIPAKKPVFQSQALEVFRTLAREDVWCRGGVMDDLPVSAAMKGAAGVPAMMLVPGTALQEVAPSATVEAYSHSNAGHSHERLNNDELAVAEVSSPPSYDLRTKQPIRKTLFFPDHEEVGQNHPDVESEKLRTLEVFLKYLDSAREAMDVCVFAITDDRIAQSLLNAHRLRGVRVRVITDDMQCQRAGSDAERLRGAGIELRYDLSKEYHMHHKFAILDGCVLLNGSFNWTRQASEHNNENVVITNEQGFVADYQRCFDNLWQEFNPVR